MYCTNCGSMVKDEAKFCWSCGCEIRKTDDDAIDDDWSEDIEKAIYLIEDVFYINGRGTVVTGYVEFGEIYVKDEAEIVRYGNVIKSTMVMGIELKNIKTPYEMGKLCDCVCEGDERIFYIGLLLRGVKPTEVARGDKLVVWSR